MPSLLSFLCFSCIALVSPVTVQTIALRATVDPLTSLALSSAPLSPSVLGSGILCSAIGSTVTNERELFKVDVSASYSASFSKVDVAPGGLGSFPVNILSFNTTTAYFFAWTPARSGMALFSYSSATSASTVVWSLSGPVYTNYTGASCRPAP